MITLAASPITTARLLSRHKAAEGTMAFRSGGPRPGRKNLRLLSRYSFLTVRTPATRQEFGKYTKKGGTGRACEQAAGNE
jgi:hypothetical protein